MSWVDFRKILAKTFKRPRCAIPITNCSTPFSAAASIKASSAGIMDSPPSKENRFWPTYLVCKKFSKETASFNLLKICCFWSASKLGWLSLILMRSWIHWITCGFLMYMYSIPICWQYTFFRCLRMSCSVEGWWPNTLAASKTVFKSALVSPKFSNSNVGKWCLRSRTGLVSVNKWPLVR